jgi:hypothetical protein
MAIGLAHLRGVEDSHQAEVARSVLQRYVARSVWQPQ